MTAFILSILLDVIPFGHAFVEPLQKRDSILVADQLQYGMTLDNVLPGAAFGFPDFKAVSSDTLTLVRDWQVDTLKGGAYRAYVVLAPFEPGTYELPDIPLLRQVGDALDTIVFEGCTVEVKTIPIDTATFVVHDLKPQITYPVTFAEVAAVGGIALGGLAVIAAIVLLIIYIVRRSGGKVREQKKEPAYIVALRALEGFRGKEHWEDARQKHFYSGVTDILKVYMEDRFGVDAPEMTTAELFDALKGEQDITPELYAALKDLFERADFVKFAKYTAGEQENAGVLPLATRFVTTMYNAEQEREASCAAAEGGAQQ